MFCYQPKKKEVEGVVSRFLLFNRLRRISNLYLIIRIQLHFTLYITLSRITSLLYPDIQHYFRLMNVSTIKSFPPLSKERVGIPFNQNLPHNYVWGFNGGLYRLVGQKRETTQNKIETKTTQYKGLVVRYVRDKSNNNDRQKTIVRSFNTIYDLVYLLLQLKLGQSDIFIFS